MWALIQLFSWSYTPSYKYCPTYMWDLIELGLVDMIPDLDFCPDGEIDPAGIYVNGW